METLREEVVRRYAEGQQAIRIAAELGVSTTSVYWNLDKAGIRRRQQSGPRVVNPHLASLITEGYQKGESTRSLAQTHGLGVKTILRALHQAGADVRKQGVAPKHWGGIRAKAAVKAELHGDEILKLYGEDGWSQQQIADHLGISQSVVSRVVIRAGTGRCTFKGADHHAWKGGRIRHSEGYFAVMPGQNDVIGKEMANSLGYVPEHRLVMAAHLGRALSKSESVHHINGKKDDNRIENLQLRQGKHGVGVVMRCACCGSENIVATHIKGD